MNRETEHEGYGLVMPFVTVASKGGSHDDQSYAAGWAMGALDRDLATSTNRTETATVLTENVPQADLIAMRHGWTLTTQETEVPEWTVATFTRPMTLGPDGEVYRG